MKKEKYKQLKLTDKELEVLKMTLMIDTLNYNTFKNSKEYEKEVEKDYFKYAKLHKENVIKERIITIINYLGR